MLLFILLYDGSRLTFSTSLEQSCWQTTFQGKVGTGLQDKGVYFVPLGIEWNCNKLILLFMERSL